MALPQRRSESMPCGQACAGPWAKIDVDVSSSANRLGGVRKSTMQQRSRRSQPEHASRPAVRHQCITTASGLDSHTCQKVHKYSDNRHFFRKKKKRIASPMTHSSRKRN